MRLNIIPVNSRNKNIMPDIMMYFFIFLDFEG